MHVAAKILAIRKANLESLQLGTNYISFTSDSWKPKTDRIYKISKASSLLHRIVDELVDHIWFFHLRVHANEACLIYFKLYSDWHVAIQSEQPISKNIYLRQGERKLILGDPHAQFRIEPMSPKSTFRIWLRHRIYYSPDCRMYLQK